MKIVELNGGLGNQICQYAFSRWLEIVCGQENVMLDDMYFSITNTHSGFELNRRFPNIKLNLLKNLFDADTYGIMIDICNTPNIVIRMANILQANGMETVLVADEYLYNIFEEGKPFYFDYKFDGITYKVTAQNIHLTKTQFFDGYLSKHENIYYSGAWINENVGKSIKTLIEHELAFTPLTHAENIAYRDDMLSKDVAIGLHIRRGDFIKYNKSIPTEYYETQVLNLKSTLADGTIKDFAFYIFSDDIPWCKENFKKLGLNDLDNITFIEGNDILERHHLDMQLMTYCDYLLHDRASSFCVGAVLISEKEITRIMC